MTGIPAGLLPHTITIIRPVESTDGHGSPVFDYAGGTRTTLQPGTAAGGAWLQQDRRGEARNEGRRPATQEWLLMCNYADVARRDRIEWAEHPAGTITFEVEGPPEPAYDPAGYHHLEATLRVVDG